MTPNPDTKHSSRGLFATLAALALVGVVVVVVLATAGGGSNKAMLRAARGQTAAVQPVKATRPPKAAARVKEPTVLTPKHNVATAPAAKAAKPATPPGPATPAPARQPTTQAPPPQPAPAPAPAPAAKPSSGIPQNNGGDADPDNNGGPNDGDGNI